MRSAYLLLVMILAGCHSSGESLIQSENRRASGSGDLYVYTDAQGNLVTLQRQAEIASSAVSEGGEPANTGSTSQRTVRESSLNSPVEGYRPSAEVDEELAKRENDRFISYVDETGQLVSRPLDMGAAREAARSTPLPYEPIASAPYLESYRALRADCCGHLLEDAERLQSGSEVLLEFGPNTPVMVGEFAYRAHAFSLPETVSRVTLMAFIRKQGYLGAEMLWLDKNGSPVMLIDQPFSRKYPENWYRYGYLQGTVEREAGQYYLVVFLPYFEARKGTDGLKLVTAGEMVLTVP